MTFKETQLTPNWYVVAETNEDREGMRSILKRGHKMDTKKCTKCKKLKSLKDFHKDSKNKGGLRYDCKVCNVKSAREWQKANPERHIANSRKWYKENSEKKSEYLKKRHSEKPWEKQFSDAVEYAVKTGKLIKSEFCIRRGCENLATEAHHPIYWKGYEYFVLWLCRSCHKDWHSKYEPTLPHEDRRQSNLFD